MQQQQKRKEAAFQFFFKRLGFLFFFFCLLPAFCRGNQRSPPDVAELCNHDVVPGLTEIGIKLTIFRRCREPSRAGIHVS